MDPNQTNQNPAPVGDGGMGMPVTDPNVGVQVPPVSEPTMPTPPATPVEPVATPTPEPMPESTPTPEQPIAPVEPGVPQGGDMGGGQMPPTTPPPAV